MPGPRELLAIPLSRSTWRGIAYLMIGAALAAPYLVLAGFAVEALEGGLGRAGAWALTSALYFVALPVATGALATVRELEVSAARRLLGVALADDGGAARAPIPSLADLQRLVSSTRSAGIDVAAELTGPIDDVPQAVSREAYRIVQESLTIPLDGTREQRPGGGRGLNGIQERVMSLRGEVSAGPDAGRWRIAVRLALHPTP